MINRLSKAFVVAHSNGGATTRKETLVFHSRSVVAKATKTIIRLKALANIIARSLASVKVSTLHIFVFHVWFSSEHLKLFFFSFDFL